MRMFGVDLEAPKARTEAMAQKAFEELMHTPHLWVVDAGTGYLGHIKLYRLHMCDQRAAIAVWIEDVGARGKGYGTEAIALLLRHAFETLGLHRIAIRVLAINERAIRAYTACGFVLEGRERETAKLAGVWQDDLMLG
jgi:RimJ/RimL family protein N-acetyltransferase